MSLMVLSAVRVKNTRWSILMLPEEVFDPPNMDTKCKYSILHRSEVTGKVNVCEQTYRQTYAICPPFDLEA